MFRGQRISITSRWWLLTIALALSAFLTDLVPVAEAGVPVEPAGSYTQTCRKCRGSMKTSLMTCECRRRNGTWVKASVNYKFCCRGVETVDGKLRCQNPVKGDFAGKCHSCTTRGYTLLCTCPLAKGRWTRATIFCKECPKGVVNYSKGKLRCVRKSQGGGK